MVISYRRSVIDFGPYSSKLNHFLKYGSSILKGSDDHGNFYCRCFVKNCFRKVDRLQRCLQKILWPVLELSSSFVTFENVFL